MEDLGRREGGLNLRLLSWNLFHGRDFPPGGRARDLTWRVAGRPERRGDHVLVNRSLEGAFRQVLDGIEWDVALLQEVPPSWVDRLAAATGAEARFAPTSRNWMSPFTRSVWTRRPHLVGSWEGGGNLILVRRGGGVVMGGSGSSLLTRTPERRVVQYVRLEDGPDVYNLHASTGPTGSMRDVLAAARYADRNSDRRPFVFGGDLNCRPSGDGPFPELSRRFGLEAPPPGMADSIDHLLARGLEVVDPPRLLDTESREVIDPATGLRIRLSDHPPVVARFGT